jgi:hypothetical protein
VEKDDVMHNCKWQVVEYDDALPQMAGSGIYCDDDKNVIDHDV